MDTKEDLRHRISRCLEKMGPYHILLLCTYTTFSLTAGYTNTVSVFYTYTPDFMCKDGGAESLNWCLRSKSSENCSFVESEYDSIVTDYKLICSERYLVPMSTTIYFLGVTLGALIFGPLSDYMGRLRTIQICTAGHILTGLLLHFKVMTPTVSAFIALRFFQGGFNQGMQTTAYTSLMELTPKKFRTLLCCIWEIFWSLGLVYVGTISMHFYEWRTVQLFLVLPTALGLLATIALPESMHWQWTKNKFRQAIKSYTRIAKLNGDKKFQEEEKFFLLNKNWPLIEAECKRIHCLEEQHQKTSGFSMIFVIFKHAVLRKHILIMGMFWFTVTMCYYAITFSLPRLAGNRHTNFIMGGGIECVAYVLVFLALNKFGRPNVLGILTIVNGTLCVTYAVTELFPMSYSAMSTSSLILMLGAKACSVAGFCGMFLFTGELFPTMCRGTIFGYCGFWSRVGSLIAPQIVSWAELVSPALPMFLLGGLLAISGGFMFLLPETISIEIPNTLQDVDDLWGKKNPSTGVVISRGEVEPLTMTDISNKPVRELN